VIVRSRTSALWRRAVHGCLNQTDTSVPAHLKCGKNSSPKRMATNTPTSPELEAITVSNNCAEEFILPGTWQQRALKRALAIKRLVPRRYSSMPRAASRSSATPFKGSWLYRHPAVQVPRMRIFLLHEEVACQMTWTWSSWLEMVGRIWHCRQPLPSSASDFWYFCYVVSRTETLDADVERHAV
jgi:hypothetical protein